jgi:hypothetical protein
MTNEEFAAVAKELVDTLQEQKNFCAGTTAEIKLSLKNLGENIATVNEILSKGANGKSLVVRVALLEQKVDTTNIKLASIEKKIDASQKQKALGTAARLGFWSAIITALITSVTAICIALQKA